MGTLLRCFAYELLRFAVVVFDLQWLESLGYAEQQEHALRDLGMELNDSNFVYRRHDRKQLENNGA